MSDTSLQDMAESPAQDAPPSSRRRKIVLFLTVPVLLAAGLYTGMTGFSLMNILSRSGHSSEKESLANIDFVPIDAVVISVGSDPSPRHLRFGMTIETTTEFRKEIDFLKPRILDVINSYLRALAPQQIEEQGALLRLRGQILRRVQMVTGEGRVRDILVTEFVLN